MPNTNDKPDPFDSTRDINKELYDAWSRRYQIAQEMGLSPRLTPPISQADLDAWEEGRVEGGILEIGERIEFMSRTTRPPYIPPKAVKGRYDRFDEEEWRETEPKMPKKEVTIEDKIIGGFLEDEYEMGE